MALRVAPNVTNTIATRFEYELKLVYRGNEVLPTDPDDPLDYNENYRTKFELEKKSSGDDSWSEVDADTEIPKEDAGECYRVLVLDNHAIRGSDTIRGARLLGSGGSTTSKPAYYEAREWDRDVCPAVPFRVEVRVKVGEDLVEIEPGQLFIGWKTPDPEEELSVADSARNPARPRQWLRDFFRVFKRDSENDSSHEDDNCSDQFGGARPREGSPRPSGVLYQSPFERPSEEALEQGADDDFARSAVEPDEDDATLGISDIFFFPPPVGGDNYRFTISLRNEAGRQLRFKDTNDNELTEYTTGTVTLWRKTAIELMVTFDGVDQAIIVWDDVKDAYRAAFIEVVPPEADKIVEYNEAVWKEVVRAYFRTDVRNPVAGVIGNDSHYEFGGWLLPTFPADSLPANDRESGHPSNAWAKRHGKALAKKFLHRAYGERDAVTDPRADDTEQDSCPGLFVFLGHRVHPNCTLLGSYLGDREFMMVTNTSCDMTKTFTHEMGHALFLRHSLVKFHGASNSTLDVANKNWLDHDQDDAIPCVMSYSNYYYGPTDGRTVRSTNPVQWHFCGVCLLKLRFWDMVRLQANAAFQEMIYEKFRDIVLQLVYSNDPYLLSRIRDDGIRLRRSESLALVALARAESTNNASGGPFKKNLSSMSGGNWVSTDPAVVGIGAHGPDNEYQGLLAPSGSGSAEVYFQIGDVESNRVSVTITD